MTHRVIADLETGTAVLVSLTAEEEAELMARRDSAAQREADEARALVRAELARIDAKSVRPLRAILAAQAAGLASDPTDAATLTGLKAQADMLRASLAT